MNWAKIGLFAAGVLFGTAGIKANFNSFHTKNTIFYYL